MTAVQVLLLTLSVAVFLQSDPSVGYRLAPAE